MPTHKVWFGIKRADPNLLELLKQILHYGTFVWHRHILKISNGGNKLRYHWYRCWITAGPNEILGEHPKLLKKIMIDTCHCFRSVSYTGAEPSQQTA